MEAKQRSFLLASKIFNLRNDYKMIREVLHMHKDILDSDQLKELENEQRSLSNQAAANNFNVSNYNGPTPVRVPQMIFRNSDETIEARRDATFVPQDE